MDLKAIGFNYNWINGANTIERNNSGVRKTREEAENDKSKPQTKRSSLATEGKGRVIDVSF